MVNLGDTGSKGSSFTHSSIHWCSHNWMCFCRCGIPGIWRMYPQSFPFIMKWTALPHHIPDTVLSFTTAQSSGTKDHGLDEAMSQNKHFLLLSWLSQIICHGYGNWLIILCCLHVVLIPLTGLPWLASVGEDVPGSAVTWCIRVNWYQG